ncbi:hypothetical protein F5Y09DRAFT_108972 [Xylaria sp. FL1042]|nr:hypothetical protein F5Y09DRAFT_108972 [Xylaria sp. FL1042]
MRLELALATTAAVGTTATPYARQSSSPIQLFNFSTPIPFENSFLASESQLLATTLASNNLYQLNPQAESPSAESIAQLPGATGVTGVTQIVPGKFAVLGGVAKNVTYGYYNETVYTVDFNNNAADNTPTVEVVASLPDALLLNGVAALPAAPHVILITDSIAYCIWRVDTTTGAVDKVLSDEPTLSVPANATFPLGANGLKIHGGHAYFTNTGSGLFARVPITAAGDKAGEVEVIATVPAGTNFDDLAVDEAGIAYLAQSPGAVVRVTPDGETSFVVGADGDTTLAGPTSITLPKGGKKAYVTTRGAVADGVSGQLWEISL